MVSTPNSWHRAPATLGIFVSKRNVFCYNKATLGILDWCQLSVKIELNCRVPRWCHRELLGVGNKLTHQKCCVCCSEHKGRWGKCFLYKYVKIKFTKCAYCEGLGAFYMHSKYSKKGWNIWVLQYGGSFVLLLWVLHGKHTLENSDTDTRGYTVATITQLWHFL